MPRFGGILEDIQYHLYVLQRIERGREDVEAGRVLPQGEVEQRRYAS